MENKHNKNIGSKGEALAKSYLENKGYLILAMNWRHGHWEVDIIAAKNGKLHFVEVKTRTSAKYGPPEASVSAKKMQFLRSAAEIYQWQHPEWDKVQFDILGIYMPLGAAIEYLFNEDVYF